MYTEAQQIQTIIQNAHKIVIIQADNPDADSLGSALALEHILGELGKEPVLYCAVDMPGYLRYMQGWDRVQPELPKQFDASIVVDASTMTLLERLVKSGQQSWVAAKPCVVLDHHETVENPVQFATVTINDSGRSSAGELIYHVAKQLDWPMPVAAQECLMSSILGDTQGLSNKLASADTYRVMAEMVEAGVDRPTLEELRRQFGKMPADIYRYKADLISRTEFSLDGRLALVSIPQGEINKYSPLYNPAPLIQGDMLQVSGVAVAIVVKTYDDGRITGAIRTNPAFGIAADLAESLGGGGHANASGFKITSGKKLADVIELCNTKTEELLAGLDTEIVDATL